MKTKMRVLAVVAAMLSTAISVNGQAASKLAMSAHAKTSSKQSALSYHDEWRKLWEDHIT